ncbi:MAG: STAS domain-containing protein [Bacteroidota bacterium]|nr:STAS domain-containing protein [Bacteroidota bacterium]
MEITRSVTGKHHILRVRGKLDAYWSDALSNELETTVRSGAAEISLDLAGVSFISSAGLRVLLLYLKQMRAINGVLRIVQPSEKVRDIFDLSGLTELLLQTAEDESLCRDDPMEPLEDGSGSFCLYPLERQSRGCVDYHAPRDEASDHYTMLKLPSERFGFGIGAFGDVGSGVERQFGEFLSAGGVTICLPTDERNHPDYMIEDGVFVPAITLYSGMVADARFSTELRFEASEQLRGMPFSRLARLAITHTEGDAALLLIAETASLIGSSLRLSPVPHGLSWTVPELRQQFAFTTEPSFPRSVVVLCAVVSRQPAPYLRPLAPGADVYGHAHAAIFAYRPMPTGKIDPNAYIRALVDEEHVHSVLHLMYDNRNALRSTESEFIRGAMFLHPLQDVHTHVQPPERAAEATREGTA